MNNLRNFRLKLIFLALCILILLAIRGHIKLGYAPEIERKSIAVAFDYYGAFEKEVEVLVSYLEEAYMEVRGIKDIYSVSEPGRGYIFCQFSDQTRLDEAYVQISDITAYVYADFPDVVNRPVITKSLSDSYPVYISWFPMAMGKELDAERIREAYEAVPGVGEVELGGQKKKELMVELHTDRLAGMTQSSWELSSRLRSSNLAGKVVLPTGETLVLYSHLSSVSDFGQVQVEPNLRLSDIATLDYKEAESQSLGHIDGQSMLLFFIMKSGEGNTVRLCRKLDAVTSHFGGSRFFSLGNKIEKSFIATSSILFLLFIFLLFDLWFKTKNFSFVAQATCRCVMCLLAAIASVSTAGYQVDMTVMAALFLVIVISFAYHLSKNHDYVPQQYNEPINIQDIATLRSIGRKSINDFTNEEVVKAGKWAYKFWQQLGIKSPFFRRLYGDWRETDTSRVEVVDIPTISTDQFDEYIKGQRGFVDNYDTKQENSDDWKIRISANGERNTESHSSKKKLSVKALAGINNLVKYAILLDTEVNERHSNNNTEVTFDHKFYALGKSGNETGLYKITVEEIYQDIDHPHDKRFHHIRYIKKIADNVGSLINGNPSTASTRTMSATDYTVADLYSLVKQYDKDFKPIPAVYHRKRDLALTAFVMLFTLIVILYFPVHLRNLVLPFCITLASGLFAYAIFQFFMKENSVLMPRISLWCFSPIFLFVLFLISHSFLSPFASDVSFSMEYESGTSFPFIQQSALDVETALLKWNEFDHLTLHIDQGRASFTIIGGKKCDILRKIHKLSAAYPEIFFYIPEKHTKHSIDVIVYGNDVPEIENNILRLAKYVNKSTDNVNIIYNFKSDVTDIILEIPVKCASVGLYPFDVYKSLYYTISEPVVDKYFAGDVETDVKIRGDSMYRETLSGILSVPILSTFGRAGVAGDYINVLKESSQGRIYHRNRMRSMSLSVTGISRTKLNRLVADFPFTGNCHGEVVQ